MTNHVTSCDNVENANAVRCPVIIRLEHAGKTLLAMRETGFSPNIKLKRYDVVRTVWENYSSAAPAVKPPAPSAADLRLMDEALDWILLIPDTMLPIRKVVTARIWVHPLNDRYLYSWRRIAAQMHADHKQIQRWHEKGITTIKKTLARITQTTL